jgi:hypothetical protein
VSHFEHDLLLASFILTFANYVWTTILLARAFNEDRRP